MITSIGLVELNSIARGIETADHMLKAGSVDLVFAKPVCPGKYIILVHGDIGSVNSAMAVGIEAGGIHVVNDLIIPRVHPTLIPAINAVDEVENVEALGVIEYFDIASAIVGADAAAKTGNIRLIEVRLGFGIGGKSYISLCGEVSDVRSAVAAGLADTEDRGAVIQSCVIPSPDPSLFEHLL